MKIDYTSKGHFQKRVDDHLRGIAELDGVSDQEIAGCFNNPIAEVVIGSGKVYREVMLNGVIFGLGYTTKGDTHYIRTVISPNRCEFNATSDEFRGTRTYVRR